MFVKECVVVIQRKGRLYLETEDQVCFLKLFNISTRVIMHATSFGSEKQRFAFIVTVSVCWHATNGRAKEKGFSSYVIIDGRSSSLFIVISCHLLMLLFHNAIIRQNHGVLVVKNSGRLDEPIEICGTLSPHMNKRLTKAKTKTFVAYAALTHSE